MSLLEILDGGEQVKILGEVTSLEDALRAIGLTREEYNDYVDYKEDKDFY